MSLMTAVDGDVDAPRPGPGCWFCLLPADLRAEIDQALKDRAATHRQVVLFLHAVADGTEKPARPLPKGYDPSLLAAASKGKIETHTRSWHHLGLRRGRPDR